MDHFMTALSNLEFIERKEPQQIFTEEIGYQSLLEREVFFRRLTPIAVGNPRLRYRFIKEARLLASLRHPNLVQVYDAGFDENNLAYMVVEKPGGMTLQQRLDLANSRVQPLEQHEAARIVADVAAGVDQIHRHHTLVHDLRPANIILAGDGRAVLTGLGQELPEDILSISARQLAYAAPERVLGGHVDRGSDIYSLGVLLYHLLFGRLPFEGSSSGIISQKHTAPYLPGLEPDRVDLPCSPAIAGIIRRATARELSQRYDAAAAFRSALQQLRLEDHQAEELEVIFAPVDLPYKANGHNGHNVHNGHNGHNDHNGYNGHNGHQNGLNLNEFSPAVASPGPLTVVSAPAKPDTHHNGNGVATRTAHLPVPAPATTATGSLEIDPLMPGRDNPALQAAIPFTTLVPMPAAAEPEAQPVAALAAGPVQQLPVRPWLVWLGLLGVLAAVAATRLG